MNADWYVAAPVITGSLIACAVRLVKGVPPVRKITSTGAHTARALRDSDEDSRTLDWARSLRRRPPAVVDVELPADLPARPAPALDAASPWDGLPNAAAGNWLPAPADRPWLARPDLDDLDDTGALPRFADWARTAPLSEVRRG